MSWLYQSEVVLVELKEEEARGPSVKYHTLSVLMPGSVDFLSKLFFHIL